MLAGLLLAGYLAQAEAPATLPRREFRYQSANAGRATYSHDGRLVLVASAKRSQIGIYHGRTALLVSEFRGHRQVVGSLASWPDRDTIASGDASGRLLFWQPKTGNIVGRAQVPGRVVALQPQPGGTLVAVLTTKTANLVNSASGKRLALPVPPGKLPVSLVFNADGSQLAMGYVDGNVTVYDLKTHQQRRAKPFSTPVRSLAFRTDSLLATAGTPGLFVWQYAASEPGQILAVTKALGSVAQQRAQGLLLGTLTGEVLRYDLDTRAETVISTAKSPVRELVVNPHERLVLANYGQAAPKSWLLR
ncbi:WD40 repeat domain-containing protein [Fibrella aquatilis]|uniref:WD40 repeat domain-containing protein n=1 Tax=Fibrella aquatilis TaxID=2817059 RepID=A0A939FZY0_9BACT|nr:WD40 repeat domain-containing protein [Fibrella aquatilis]MBO0929817.1 WD40 repeat domain-containing protein [Fibrella aquatilis]